jgi:hypothetical protein
MSAIALPRRLKNPSRISTLRATAGQKQALPSRCASAAPVIYAAGPERKENTTVN